MSLFRVFWALWLVVRRYVFVDFVLRPQVEGVLLFAVC